MAAPEKKLVKSKSGLRMVPVKDIHTSPFTLSEPPWVPDNECVSCMQCQARFDFRRRRHHCRRCGKCFCNACCENKESLQRMCFVDPVRHCFGCGEISKKENEFFDKHLKILQNGGQFVIPVSDQSIEEGSLFNCKLSSDHREVSFDGESDKHEPVQVEKIESVQILTTGIDTEGNTVPSGIAIKYKGSKDDNVNVVKMVVVQGSAKKQGQCWIASMQKAFKMIYDTRMSYRQ